MSTQWLSFVSVVFGVGFFFKINVLINVNERIKRRIVFVKLLVSIKLKIDIYPSPDLPPPLSFKTNICVQ